LDGVERVLEVIRSSVWVVVVSYENQKSFQHVVLLCIVELTAGLGYEFLQLKALAWSEHDKWDRYIYGLAAAGAALRWT
jgi:hypothetical protein